MKNVDGAGQIKYDIEKQFEVYVVWRNKYKPLFPQVGVHVRARPQARHKGISRQLLFSEADLLYLCCSPASFPIITCNVLPDPTYSLFFLVYSCLSYLFKIVLLSCL